MHLRLTAAGLAGTLFAVLFMAPSADALPLPPDMAAASPPTLIVPAADGCRPGLIRGRLGACVVGHAVIRRGRILHKGCHKRINATLRTPC